VFLTIFLQGGILAATQPKLLHVAFDTRRSDKAFVPVFLVAFRYFTSPLEVFAYLRDKYTGGSGDARARSMTVLERWVALHLYDFLDSLPLAKLLVDLLVLRLARADAADVKAALRSALRSAGGPVDGATSAFPPAVMPQIFRGTSFDVLDLAPLELARQVSLVQHGMFAKIDARELLQDAWTGPDGATKAPHVNAFIANFNQLCGWISSVIVSTRPMIPRIALIHRFIDVAKCCLELQNYNGAMAILGALLSNPVHRLKEDWEAVPRDSQDIFAEVRALFATTGNFKAYRAAIAAAVPPAVPYLGLALQDLTFFETNKDTKVRVDCGIFLFSFLTR
jgi:son of sevenless-like protein